MESDADEFIDADSAIESAVREIHVDSTSGYWAHIYCKYVPK